MAEKATRPLVFEGGGQPLPAARGARLPTLRPWSLRRHRIEGTQREGESDRIAETGIESHPGRWGQQLHLQGFTLRGGGGRGYKEYNTGNKKIKMGGGHRPSQNFFSTGEQVRPRPPSSFFFLSTVLYSGWRVKGLLRVGTPRYVGYNLKATDRR